MNVKANVVNPDAWVANAVSNVSDRTSQTDDERIKDITVLPPPEHLIRFFPIHGTKVESLIDGPSSLNLAIAVTRLSDPNALVIQTYRFCVLTS